MSVCSIMLTHTIHFSACVSYLYAYTCICVFLLQCDYNLYSYVAMYIIFTVIYIITLLLKILNFCLRYPLVEILDLSHHEMSDD